jgi:hypothetical protein
MSFLKILFSIILCLSLKEITLASEKLDKVFSCERPFSVLGITKSSNKRLSLNAFLHIFMRINVIYLGRDLKDILALGHDYFMEKILPFYSDKLYDTYITLIKKIHFYSDNDITGGNFIEKCIKCSINYHLGLLKNVLGYVDGNNPMDKFFNNGKEFSKDEITKKCEVYFWGEEAKLNNDLVDEVSQITNSKPDFCFVVFNEYFFSKEVLEEEEVSLIRGMIGKLCTTDTVVVDNFLYCPASEQESNFDMDKANRFVKYLLKEGEIALSKEILSATIDAILNDEFMPTKTFINESRVYVNGMARAKYLKSSYLKESDWSLLKNMGYSFGNCQIDSYGVNSAEYQSLYNYCNFQICADNSFFVVPSSFGDEYQDRNFLIIQSNYLPKGNVFTKGSSITIWCDARYGTKVYFRKDNAKELCNINDAIKLPSEKKTTSILETDIIEEFTNVSL